MVPPISGRVNKHNNILMIFEIFGDKYILLQNVCLIITLISLDQCNKLQKVDLH